jgi:IS30 family transposase
VIAGHSIRSIADRRGRAPSTFSREISRNGGSQGYRANLGDRLALERARRPKVCKLVGNRELAQIVAGKLQSQCSLEQIAGWSKHGYAFNGDYQVSHETTFGSRYIRARGALEIELLEHLRVSRAMRHSRHHTMKTEDHGRICDAVSISERPAAAEDVLWGAFITRVGTKRGSQGRPLDESLTRDL